MSHEADAARQRIDELERQLAWSRQALEDFTYSVSHDLRAPLRHVGAYLKIVQEDLGVHVDPAIAAHLRTASESAAHMGRLMDALQELSRLGRAEMHWSEVDLRPLLDDARRRLEPESAGRPITWNIAADLPRVRGDMVMLGQMLVQLLGNALKFTRLAPAPCIGIAWEPEKPGWCTLHVRDNGVGFDARLQDRLFRVFQHLHSSKQFEGLGAGLVFARIVAERHGGCIRARGDLAPGCEVSVRLPLALTAPA